MVVKFLALVLLCLVFEPAFSQEETEDMSKAELVSGELRAVTAGLAKELGVAQKRYEAYISKADQTEAVLAPGFGKSRFEPAARILETRLAFYRRRVGQLRQSINLLSEQKTKTEEAYLEQANFNDQTIEDAKNILEKAPGSVKAMVEMLESTVGAYKQSISVAQEDTMKSFSTTRTLLHHHMGLFKGARDKLKEISALMQKAAEALDIGDQKFKAQPDQSAKAKSQFARDQLRVFKQIVTDIEDSASVDLAAPSNPDEGWGAIVADEDELANEAPQIEGLSMAEDDKPLDIPVLPEEDDADTTEHSGGDQVPEDPPVLERPSIHPEPSVHPSSEPPVSPLGANCKVCTEIPTCENCKTCSISDRTCNECPKATCMDGADGSQPAVPVPKLPVKPEIPVVPGAKELTASLQCVRCGAEKPTCAGNCQKCKITEQDCRTCPMAICEKSCAACPKQAPTCDPGCLDCTVTKRTCESCPIAMCRRLKYLLDFPSSDNFMGGRGEVTRRGSATAWEETTSNQALFVDYPLDMVGFRFKPSTPVGAIYMVAFLSDPTAEKPISAVVPPPAPPSATVPAVQSPIPPPPPAPVDGATPIPPVPEPAPGAESADQEAAPAPPAPPAETPAEPPAPTLLQTPSNAPPGYGVGPSKPIFSSFIELAGGARGQMGAKLRRRMSRGRALQPTTAAGGVAAGKTGLTVLGNDVVVYCNGQVAKLEPNLIQKANSFSAVVSAAKLVEFYRNGAHFYTCETTLVLPAHVVVASPATGAHPTDLQFIRRVDVSVK